MKQEKTCGNCGRDCGKIIFPCCKTLIPAPLDGVELATCKCGKTYTPEILKEYSEMQEIIIDWNSIIAQGKAFIKAEKGQEHFISDLIRRGMKYSTNPPCSESCDKCEKKCEYNSKACSFWKEREK